MKILATFVFLSVVAASAFAQGGPFGFEKGMTKQQVIHLLGKPMSSEGDLLMFDTAPKPHTGYAVYSLIFSPKEGLLKVIAGGHFIPNRRSWDRVAN